MKNTFAIGAGLLVAFGAMAGGLLGRLPVASSSAGETSPARIVIDYREAVDVVDNNYVDKIDHEKITDSSVQGMLWTLDPHSSFFTRAEFNKLNEEQSSQFYGIGVSILQHRDGVYVQSVVPGTPAEKAGLHYGDRFVDVDGKDAKDWTSAEVSKNVRGERGTTVKIRVERVASPKPVEFDIVRGGVPLPSIRNFFMLPNATGYIGLTGGFQETTADELTDAMARLDKQGMKALVLDLRGNPGGILEQAIAVVSKFVPSNKTVVSVKGRSSYAEARELRSSGEHNDTLPLVVLINGGSASASEIVAGAIQDYDRGVIVGTDSFGKGLVQRIFRMPYGTGLTLTTARYYTPFGRSLQRDYSNGSIYDYYTHHDDDDDDQAAATKPAGQAVTMPDGRTLYGGRGIEPDVAAKATKFSVLRGRIADAAFFFSRQLVAGKVAGFENYKADHQDQSLNIQPGVLVVNDKLFSAFKAFTTADKEGGLSSANIDTEADFARTRLRSELATANFSNEAGIQVLLEADSQVAKGIEVVPQARKVLENNIALK